MRAWRQRWAAVFGCGGDATAIGSGDDVSLHLQGVEGDEGGGRPINDERLGRGKLTGGNRRWRIPTAVWSNSDVESRGRQRCALSQTESHGRGRNREKHDGYLVTQGGENGAGSTRAKEKEGVSGRHDVAVGVVGTWHWQWCRSNRCGQRSGGAIEAHAKVRGGPVGMAVMGQLR
jgi:hypothetical protein